MQRSEPSIPLSHHVRRNASQLIPRPISRRSKLLRILLGLVGLDARQLLLHVLVDRVIGVLVLAAAIGVVAVFLVDGPGPAWSAVGLEILIVAVRFRVSVAGCLLAEVALVTDGASAGGAACEAGGPTCTEGRAALAGEDVVEVVGSGRGWSAWGLRKTAVDAVIVLASGMY